MNADNIDLARLAMIEGNVANKFPGFNGFEEFGYGSFLKFLTKHQDLLEAIEQVGGMARSGRVGTKLGHEVSLDSVLDFIAQCGTQTSLVSLNVHEIKDLVLFFSFVGFPSMSSVAPSNSVNDHILIHLVKIHLKCCII